MRTDVERFQEDLLETLESLDGCATGPEEHKLSISTTFTHPDSSRTMSGFLSPQFRYYLMRPERILKAKDLDSLKELMGDNPMSSIEISEVLRKRRIGASSIEEIVRHIGSWAIRLPDIQVGGDIRTAYSPIIGHDCFKTRNFFEMLATQGYTTNEIKSRQYGDESIATGAMGWDDIAHYTGNITARDFLNVIDAGIKSQEERTS